MGEQKQKNSITLEFSNKIFWILLYTNIYKHKAVNKQIMTQIMTDCVIMSDYDN